MLPRLDERREQLARDEAALALSAGDPAQAALRLAERGADEPLGALLSPWGRTLLAARGVDDIDGTLRDVRAIAVQRAAQRSDSPAAIALREHVGKLGIVKGTGGNVIRKLAP